MVSEAYVHPKTNASWPVNSHLGAGHDRLSGQMDPADNNGVRDFVGLIAATVSYLHMHMLVELHGQPGWVAALTPFSVDGMIVAASTTLLADSRSGGRGGFIPWALLVVGNVASLAANVAVAEPTTIGRVIAARPSFALIGADEMLMRQVRHTAALHPDNRGQAPDARCTGLGSAQDVAGEPGRDLQRQAWHWPQANRGSNGSLPSGREIAEQFGRHERWGRLVKRSGCAGDFPPDSNPGEPKEPPPSAAVAA
jgi:hypothetical protein